MACCGTREPYPTYMYVFEVLSAEIIVIMMVMMMIIIIMIIIICYQSIHFIEEMCEVCHFGTQEASVYICCTPNLISG